MGSNPTGGMDVCCECCVLSGRGLCDGLITHPEESYRLWRVVVCDLEISKMWRLKPATGLWKIQPKGCNAKRTNKPFCFVLFLCTILVPYFWSVIGMFSLHIHTYISVIIIYLSIVCCTRVVQLINYTIRKAPNYTNM